jgi:hypothetical protein
LMRGKGAELRRKLPRPRAHLLHVIVKDAPGHAAQAAERLRVAREQPPAGEKNHCLWHGGANLGREGGCIFHFPFTV